MKRAVSLLGLVLILTGFTGIAAADVRYDKINIADFCNNPAAFDGRSIEVSGRVIAINAQSKSLELFDSQSKTVVVVRLSQLPKSERVALINNDVRRVGVSGRARMVGERLVIDAEKIDVLPIETKDQTVPLAVTN
jgi:hypothetical protein